MESQRRIVPMTIGGSTSTRLRRDELAQNLMSREPMEKTFGPLPRLRLAACVFDYAPMQTSKGIVNLSPPCQSDPESRP